MKKSFLIYLSSGLLVAATLPSCSKEFGSLNGAVIEDLITNPTEFQMINAMVGTESGIRNNLDFYFDATGVIGREMYRFAGSEPRYTTELLGKDASTLNNNTFYLTNSWNSRYRGVKNCNTIIQGCTNSKQITAPKKKGFFAVAKFLKAYQLLLNLNLTYTNGIRVDVNDPDKPGPFLSYDESLKAISDLLDESKADAAGAEFVFPLSSGFDIVKTDGAIDGAKFIQLNRAFAARVAAYRKDWPGVLTRLNESFFDLNGSLTRGAFHVYSTGANDQTNISFFRKNSNGEIRLAHPNFHAEAVAELGASDDRIGKATLRDKLASSDGLTSQWDVWVYTSNVAPVTIVRNEELILLYAEAKIRLNQYPDAIVALNRIRTAHNSPVYIGSATDEALTTDLLRQRRFSFFFEGHRWIDMRRYNKLGELPKDRPNDDVFDKFPRPLTEGQ